MSSSSSHKQLVNRVPTGLSIPDINVWLALAAPEHPHNPLAGRRWKQHEGQIAFVRPSQLGFLRLTTTAAAMDGKPLTIDEAWRLYDRFYDDDRVTFIPEPSDAEKRFREKAVGRSASPKIWGDAWMLAIASAADGVLVTLDKALGPRGAHCLLPARSSGRR
jgi:predicted nucleic acid-binding protein